MLSIILLAIVSLVTFTLKKRTRIKFLPGIFYLVVNLFLIECIIYLFFLYLVYQGNCFLLIGNQKILDAIMKTRLSYALYFSAGRKDYFNQVNSDLGHTVGKDKTFNLYRINAQGIRALKEYKLVADPGVLRVATFGDSYIFGDNVKNEDTWQQVMENSVGNLEVLNFGVETYGFGQSYLRYLQDALKFHPDVIYFNSLGSGLKDRLNAGRIITLKNLRFPYFYKVRFWIEDGVLLSKGITVYDYFDPAFRKEFIFDPLGIPIDKGFLSSRILSSTNVGLLCKVVYIRTKYAKAILEYKPDESFDEVNEMMLNNLLTTARDQGTKVVFIYLKSSENFPPYLNKILRKYGNTVLYIDQEELLKKYYAKHSLREETVLDSTNHFTPEGHKIFAEAFLDVLKSIRRLGKTSSLRFDEEHNRFIKSSQRQ